MHYEPVRPKETLVCRTPLVRLLGPSYISGEVEMGTCSYVAVEAVVVFVFLLLG